MGPRRPGPGDAADDLPRRRGTTCRSPAISGHHAGGSAALDTSAIAISAAPGRRPDRSGRAGAGLSQGCFARGLLRIPFSRMPWRLPRPTTGWGISTTSGLIASRQRLANWSTISTATKTRRPSRRHPTPNPHSVLWWLRSRKAKHHHRCRTSGRLLGRSCAFPVSASSMNRRRSLLRRKLAGGDMVQRPNRPTRFRYPNSSRSTCQGRNSSASATSANLRMPKYNTRFAGWPRKPKPRMS